MGRVLDATPVLPPREEAVEDALGRVLAADVHTRAPLPPFDHATMDGYAVRATDLAGSLLLPVVGESKAGISPPPLATRSAMRIFTGAPLPGGADTVVMQEDVVAEGGVVRFPRIPDRGANVRRRGEDIGAGEVALARGIVLGPAHLSLLASLDLARVGVVASPRVLVLPTGDELRRAGTPERPGSIPESNGVAIASMARRLGATTELVPTAGDDAAGLDRALSDALPRADVLVTIGGVSVGDHDLVRPALERAGVELAFYKVRMKPGKPLTLGRHAGGLVLGLPGNPVSAMVTFGLFGSLILRKMAGRDARHTTARARLGAPVRHKAGRRELVRAVLDGGVASPLANQASGAVLAMARANALVSVPEDVGDLAAGTDVDVYRFEAIGL